jgi:hypothetical protein
MHCPIPDNLKPNITELEAIALILDAIATEKPFAFTKYGDGESIVLQTLMGRPPEYKAPEPGTRTPSENFKALIPFYKRIILSWGADTTDHMMAVLRISDPIIDSLIHSDLVGVHNGIPEFFMASKTSYKGCSQGILAALAHPDKLDAFFQGKDVRLITSQGFHLRDNIQKRTKSKVTLTQIPFYSTITEVRQYLDTMEDFPEPLVLWGGGAGAKQIGIYLRDKFGKTCLDMGSMLDAWAGDITRQDYQPNAELSFLVIPKET